MRLSVVPFAGVRGSLVWTWKRVCVLDIPHCQPFLESFEGSPTAVGFEVGGEGEREKERESEREREREREREK